MSSFPPPQLKYKLASVDIQEHRLSRLSLWRSIVVVVCTLVVFMVAISPHWEINHQSQIKVKGDKLVSKSFIYSTLNFAYPQFIWTINGSRLAKKLEFIPSIASVRINKTIIPPELIVSIQEKVPVAVATSEGKIGFLDSDGRWIAQKFYDNINEDFALPKIKALNYQSQYQQRWSDIYQLISIYPELQISELRWSQSGNLLLQTKIGKVFLGSDLSELKKQFETMLELQNLPNYIKNSKIAYIDLSNPNLNLIQRY